MVKERFINKNKTISFGSDHHRFLLYAIEGSLLNTGHFTPRHQREHSAWSDTNNYMGRNVDENNIVIWLWIRSANTCRRKPRTFLLPVNLMPVLTLWTQRTMLCFHHFQVSKEQLQWTQKSCTSKQLLKVTKVDSETQTLGMQRFVRMKVITIEQQQHIIWVWPPTQITVIITVLNRKQCLCFGLDESVSPFSPHPTVLSKKPKSFWVEDIPCLVLGANMLFLPHRNQTKSTKGMGMALRSHFLEVGRSSCPPPWLLFQSMTRRTTLSPSLCPWRASHEGLSLWGSTPQLPSYGAVLRRGRWSFRRMRDPNPDLSNTSWVLFSLPSNIQQPPHLLLLLPAGTPGPEIRSPHPLPSAPSWNQARVGSHLILCHYSHSSLQRQKTETSKHENTGEKQNNRNSTYTNLLRVNGYRRSLRHSISKPTSNTHFKQWVIHQSTHHTAGFQNKTLL